MKSGPMAGARETWSGRLMRRLGYSMANRSDEDERPKDSAADRTSAPGPEGALASVARVEPQHGSSHPKASGECGTERKPEPEVVLEPLDYDAEELDNTDLMCVEHEHIVEQHSARTRLLAQLADDDSDSSC